MFRELSASAQSGLIDEVVAATEELAGKGLGATLVLERETGLRNYIDRGTRLDAEATVDLLVSLFHTASPLHDGAVIVDRQGRLAAARCILPLSSNPVGSAFLGTRHRSALGLTEETDAVVVVVSEETGSISVAFRGALRRDLKEAELRQAISRLLRGEHDEDASTQALPQAQTT